LRGTSYIYLYTSRNVCAQKGSKVHHYHCIWYIHETEDGSNMFLRIVIIFPHYYTSSVPRRPRLGTSLHDIRKVQVNEEGLGSTSDLWS